MPCDVNGLGIDSPSWSECEADVAADVGTVCLRARFELGEEEDGMGVLREARGRRGGRRRGHGGELRNEISRVGARAEWCGWRGDVTRSRLCCAQGAGHCGLPVVAHGRAHSKRERERAHGERACDREREKKNIARAGG